MITNRDKQAKASDRDCLKHPGSFLKSRANRRLRRDDAPLDEGARPWPSPHDRRGKAKRSGICPLCLGHLQKNTKGTRYERCCHACKGVLATERVCRYCSGHDIWVKGKQAVCKRCGRADG